MFGRHGLMVSLLNSRWSSLCFSPCWGHCVVFLGKTLLLLTLIVPPSTLMGHLVFIRTFAFALVKFCTDVWSTLLQAPKCVSSMLAPHETLLLKIVHYASRITVYNTLVGNSQPINMQNCFFLFFLSRNVWGKYCIVSASSAANDHVIIMDICTVQIRPQH